MRILGLDYGEKRVGVAISDEEKSLALKRGYLSNDLNLFEEIKKVCAEDGVEKIIVGLPLSMNGTTGPQALKVQEFVVELRKKVGLEVGFIDERLTTSMVSDKGKLERDTAAAQIILQDYLDKLTISN